MRKTKIIATLGPASSDKKTLEHMIRSGMNVARINCSHGNHEEYQKLIEHVQSAAVKLKTPIAILMDLGGPKIRIGDFNKHEHVVLRKGAEFILTTEKIAGDEKRVSINYKRLPHEVRPGTHIMIDDGKIALEVLHVRGKDIHTRVLLGGQIRPRRGVNVPDGMLSLPAITEKDRRDIEFGLDADVDYFALSFVRSANDIHALRRILKKRNSYAKIISKIETRDAMSDINAIIAATDAVMIARGDLAVEIPKEEVPIAQKLIIVRSLAAGKPVITATQMLDSMTAHPSPTRAEVNDVANAIFDGTDAIMLSQETAIGIDPAHVIRTMASIAETSEESSLYKEMLAHRTLPINGIVDAVSAAVVQVARQVGAKAIVTFSETGSTPRMVSRQKPPVPILVLTPHVSTYRQLALSWGCLAHMNREIRTVNDAISDARRTLLKMHLAHQGDTFVLVAGTPFGVQGGTNALIVQKV